MLSVVWRIGIVIQMYSFMEVFCVEISPRRVNSRYLVIQTQCLKSGGGNT